MEIIENLKKYRRALMWIKRAFVSKKELGSCGQNSVLEQPVFIENPQNVFLDKNSRIRNYCSIINSPEEKVIIKKYSVLAASVTIITNSHRSTVGVPHFLLVGSHINDKSGDVIIEEDVWIGANVTILAGVTIGRGAVIGAGAIVTKDIPPYALAIGIPAKIVATIFNLNDILKHEENLYPIDERIPIDYIKQLFETKYKGLKVFGIGKPLTDQDIIKLQTAKVLQNFIE